MAETGDGVVRVDSPTERRNPRTLDIDQLPTVEILRRVNSEDLLVAPAVREALPELAVAVDYAVATLRGGGQVHYFGAGTSGRVAAADAAEIPPTFHTPDTWFVAHHAGDSAALRKANEAAEDSADAGAADAAGLRRIDLAVGVAASGRTPYVAGALRAAAARGARTALVSSNPGAPLGAEVDVHVAVDTGPEAIAGSTRMKAGTAAKLVLCAFSTAVMVKLGRTYSNLMIDVAATNAKLRGRRLTILVDASGMPETDCVAALTAADGDLKTALVCLLTGADAASARASLAAADGRTRAAVAELTTHGDGTVTPA
jgi:N-acetylmuramic acid 6-phosphate etherase